MIIILTLLVALIGALIIFFVYRLQTSSRRSLQEMAQQIIEAQKQNQSLEFLQREINHLRDQMGLTMAESARLVGESQKNVGERLDKVGDRLDKAAEVVGQVQRSLGVLDNATKQVFMVGKDIAQLQEILRAPKLRGSLGELFLGDLLAQILPTKNFELQHRFKNGETVDAVVRLGKLVPVDAKFPLENFKRVFQTADPQEKTLARRKFVNDVKRHIDAISSKYILMDEGTFDFALMYIPAENIYYEIIIKDDATEENLSLMTYAFSKRVVPVSPNSFYAYLHTISLGLKGLEIEQNARVMVEQLSRMRADFNRFKDDFMVLGKHLMNTRGKYEDADRRLMRFEDKLLSAGGSDELPSVVEPSPTVDVLPLK